MTVTKETYVVELPLTNKDMGILLSPTQTMNDSIRAIGTRVESGVLVFLRAVMANEKSLVGVLEPKSDREIPEGFQDVPLVHLSEALAKLAERDAEIARYREALLEAKTFHEEQDKALSKQPPSSQGSWRRNLHKEQIEQIDAALKGPAA